MSVELIIRPEAEADAFQAFRWYNDQRTGLGQEFLAELDRAIESVRANPEASRKLYREYRRALTRRFPYALFYTANSQRVVEMPANNALERTVRHRGPRLAAARSSWPAAQLGR